MSISDVGLPWRKWRPNLRLVCVVVVLAVLDMSRLALQYRQFTINLTTYSADLRQLGLVFRACPDNASIRQEKLFGVTTAVCSMTCNVLAAA